METVIASVKLSVLFVYYDGSAIQNQAFRSPGLRCLFMLSSFALTHFPIIFYGLSRPLFLPEARILGLILDRQPITELHCPSLYGFLLPPTNRLPNDHILLYFL